MNPILKQRFLSWSDLSAQISRMNSNLERGDAFETFAKFYLHFFEITYQLEESHFPRVDGERFPQSWLAELSLGNRDLGIDGIYRRTDDYLVAVQVKFRTGLERLTYADLATFWSEAENAAYRMVFTNVSEITDVSTRRRGHLFVGREQLDELDDDFWEAFHIFANTSIATRPPKKSPRPYQETALTDILRGFKDHNRGKLIAACGIGKTLIGLWAMERLEVNTVLFLAPNLQLIRQTLNEWSSQTNENFTFLAVCSDQTITSELDELSDSQAATDIPITTNPIEISSFLSRDTQVRKILFSTYQSLPSIALALQGQSLEPFDLAIFDEAHKTAGLDSSTGFGIGLSDARIPIKRRLFLTATERLFSPRLQAIAQENERVVFSMDNRELYGPTFHRLTFSQAISDGIISDYRVLVAVISGADLRQVLQSHDLVINTDDEPDSQTVQRATQVINMAILKKVFEETEAKKLVSYHRSVRDAKVFAQDINRDEDFAANATEGFSVDGSMSSSRRSQIIRSFERASAGVLANARCLVEGVDIPIIDGVFFASPKNSLIDIVQAVGRALRKPYGSSGDDLAYVVVPIILDPNVDAIDVSSSSFDRLYNVIQALRDQDSGVGDQVDQLNLQISTTGTTGGRSLNGFLRLLVPAGVSVEALEASLALRIAEVNGNQTGTLASASHLTSGERGSSRERKLRTIGDYTPAKFEESLVAPTLSRYENRFEAELTREAIRINNNNIGHSLKLGVIAVSPSNKFFMTPLGKKYLEGEISFPDLFKNQILRYRESDSQIGLRYPYRLFLDVMSEVDQLTYLEFLYGIYPIDMTLENELSIEEAVQRIRGIRQLPIVPAIANEASREEIINQLESVTGLRMANNDVWTDRTTTYNQYRYFRRHLELFDDVFIDESNVFKFKDQGKRKAKEYLEASGRFLSESEYGNVMWLGL